MEIQDSPNFFYLWKCVLLLDTTPLLKTKQQLGFLLTGHSIVASCLLKRNIITCVSPAMQNSRLSAQRCINCIAKGSSSESGWQHLLLSNSFADFSLYNTCSVTAWRNNTGLNVLSRAHTHIHTHKRKKKGIYHKHLVHIS